MGDGRCADVWCRCDSREGCAAGDAGGDAVYVGGGEEVEVGEWAVSFLISSLIELLSFVTCLWWMCVFWDWGQGY